MEATDKLEDNVLRAAVLAMQEKGLLRGHLRLPSAVMGRHLAALRLLRGSKLRNQDLWTNLSLSGSSESTCRADKNRTTDLLTRTDLARIEEVIREDERQLRHLRQDEVLTAGRNMDEIGNWQTAKADAERRWARVGSAVAPVVDSVSSAFDGASIVKEEPDLSIVETLAAIARGRLSLADGLQRKPEIFLFVSSTFVDTAAERDYAQTFVWSELRALCAVHSLDFNVVDLRWGVSDETTDDHGTQQLCMSEIDRCVSRSAGMAFLFLSGERYGWRPLPKEVPQQELDTLVALIPVEDVVSRATIRHWYVLDENAQPAIFVLRRISDGESDAAGDLAPEGAIRSFWSPVGAEWRMLTALRAAAAAGSLAGEARERWLLSVTHHEVQRALNPRFNPRLARNTLCVMRDLSGLRDAVVHGASTTATNYWASDEDMQLLGQMRMQAEASIGTFGSVIRYNPQWVDGGVSLHEHGAYVRQLCADIYVRLKFDIQRAIDAYERVRLDSDQVEMVQQAAAVHRRATQFIGRKALVHAAVNLCRPTAARSAPRVVYGESGSGKTFLVCKLSACMPPECVMCARVCGTSAATTTARGLLRSACLQLRAAIGCVIDVPANVKGLAACFAALLAMGTAIRPIVVLLDSLDQLSDEDYACSEPFRWLPTELPPHACVLVSCLPDDPSRGASGHVLGTLLALPLPRLAVVAVAPGEALAFISEWLAPSRRLTAPQQSVVAGALARSANITMLYLRMLCDRLVRLSSTAVLEAPPTTTAGLVEAFFDFLEANHGVLLVSRALGLLCATQRRGLSEASLSDLLSASDDVLCWKWPYSTACEALQTYLPSGGVLQYHNLYVRRVPPLVLRRLLEALEGFVVERGGRGSHIVLAFYHRQFWEGAERRYYEPCAAFLASLVARYYAGELAAAFPSRGLATHQLPRGDRTAEALSELPDALLRAEPPRVADLVAILCSLAFVHAKCGACMGDDLRADMDAAAVAVEAAEAAGMPEADALARRIGQYRQFYRVNAHHFQRFPNLVLPTAVNGDRRLLTTSDAMGLRLAGWLDASPWIENLADHEYRDEALTRVVVKAAHNGKPVGCCAASATGQYVLSGGNDGTGRLLSASLGVPIAGCVLSGHSGPVLSVGLGGSAKLMAATGGADGQCRVYCLGSPERPAISTSPSVLRHPAAVGSLAISADGELIVTTCRGGGDSRVRFWDPSGTLLATFETGHTADITAIRLARGSPLVVTASDDASFSVLHFLYVAGAVDLVQLTMVPTGSPLTCCDISMTNRYLATGGKNRFVKLFRVPSRSTQTQTNGALIKQVKSHPGAVLCCSFSPSGKRLTTGCEDGVCRLWSVPNLTPLAAFACHASAVTSVQMVKFKFSGPVRPRGTQTLILSTGEDGALRVTVAANRRSLWQFIVGFFIVNVVEGPTWSKLIFGTLFLFCFMNFCFSAIPVMMLVMLAWGGYFHKMEYQIPYFEWTIEALGFKQSLFFLNESSHWRFYAVASKVSVAEDRGPGHKSCQFSKGRTNRQGDCEEGLVVVPRAHAWLRDLSFLPSLPFILPIIFLRIALCAVGGSLVYTLLFFPIAFAIANIVALFCSWLLLFAMKTIVTDIERLREAAEMPRLADDARYREILGTNQTDEVFSLEIEYNPSKRAKQLLFSDCGHTCARLLHGCRVELLDVSTGRDINRSSRISAEHVVMAGNKLLILNWDDVDIDLFAYGGKNRVRGDAEKCALELSGLYPLRAKETPRTGRFDGSLRVYSYDFCNASPMTDLPTYFLGDATHKIVPRQPDKFPVQAVYRAVLSPDGLRLILILATDNDTRRAALCADPSPLGLAWVFDLTPVVMRQPCNHDGRVGLYMSLFFGDPWFFWRKRLLPKPDVAFDFSLPGSGSFLCCAVSPDSLNALLGCSDGAARTWSLKDGASLLTLKGHSAPVLACDFISHSAGALMVTGSADCTIGVYAPEGQHILTLPFSGPPPELPLPVASIGISARGQLLIASGGGRVAMYDLRDLAQPHLHWTAEQSLAVAVSRSSFSPDCTLAALASEDLVSVMATPLRNGHGGSSRGRRSHVIAACALRGDGPAVVAWTPDQHTIFVGLKQGRNLTLRLRNVF